MEKEKPLAAILIVIFAFCHFEASRRAGSMWLEKGYYWLPSRNNLKIIKWTCFLLIPHSRIVAGNLRPTSKKQGWCHKNKFNQLAFRKRTYPCRLWSLFTSGDKLPFSCTLTWEHLLLVSYGSKVHCWKMVPKGTLGCLAKSLTIQAVAWRCWGMST